MLSCCRAAEGKLKTMHGSRSLVDRCGTTEHKVNKAHG